MGGESNKCDQYTVRTDTRGVVLSLALFVSASLCLCFHFSHFRTLRRMPSVSIIEVV